MSTDRLNQSFQEFLQTIYNWPRTTIEKNTLIQMLEELTRQNPELQNTYNDMSSEPVIHQLPNDESDYHSRLDPSEVPNNRSDDEQANHNNHQLSTNGNHVARKDSSPSPTMPTINISVKGGDLTVRKGSTILSPLIKKQGLKTTVHCELSYAYCDNQKLVYLTVYQNRKNRKLIHKFTMDDTCSFVSEHKREFQFKHASAIENFTTATGTADTWIASFNDVSVQRNNNNIEEVYENPEDFTLSTGLPYLEAMLTTPKRPPPRPPQPTNSILPENIYVCLYDHSSTTEDVYELEFIQGDLLYIVNTDGPNFYVGRRLIFPFDDYSRNPVGLVFKEYIRPAYEQIY